MDIGSGKVEAGFGVLTSVYGVDSLEKRIAGEFREMRSAVDSSR